MTSISLTLTQDSHSVPIRIDGQFVHEGRERMIELAPPLPLTVGESNALAGEGTLDAALAAGRWRFVHCSHGTIPAADWHEHTHDYTQVGPNADDVWAIERVPDYIHDCVVLLGDSVS